MDGDKIKIELNPYDALAIYSFLSEFEPQIKSQPLTASLYRALINYQDQIIKNTTQKQIDDAMAESETLFLIGAQPPSKSQIERYDLQPPD